MPPAEVHEHAAGLTWTEGDGMARSWHALKADGRVWLIDPVDAAGVVEAASALADVAGVLQLLDRHERDGAALAERLGVPLHRLPASVSGAPFELFKVVDKPKWREVGLWWAAQRVLVVPEAVGTGPAFAVGDGPVGVHPMLRAFGAGQLRSYEPSLLLVGHGPPITQGTAPALGTALDRSRGDLPKLLKALPGLVRG